MYTNLNAQFTLNEHNLAPLSQNVPQSGCDVEWLAVGPYQDGPRLQVVLSTLKLLLLLTCL